MYFINPKQGMSMREIKKIKLNQFSKNELDQRKLNALRGGCDCVYIGTCGCSCCQCGEEDDETLGLNLYNDTRTEGTEYVYSY